MVMLDLPSLEYGVVLSRNGNISVFYMIVSLSTFTIFESETIANK